MVLCADWPPPSPAEPPPGPPPPPPLAAVSVTTKAPTRAPSEPIKSSSGLQPCHMLTSGPASHPKTMSSPYLTGSLSSGKSPSWGCEPEPRGGEGWLLLQDGRSSRDGGGGHSASELPSKTMPTGHTLGSLLGERERERFVTAELSSRSS
ncbi:hypothetical protein EYF80_051335 [Liparis tanakae]|uniref:Uncharacterized protein n=1 Tax=Liparis tanakae TaxID=230148 RepID=A0A4Z2FC46_9TELE|nr:hypothetical protein EYF80_051335 [Liparis tanakae]